DDDVILEVDDLLEAGGLHVEQRAEPAGHGLEEPDVHDRRRQLDVAHALAAHATVRHLDAAAVADHALVLHTAVLAAGAFPVLLGTENAFAEQPILLGPVRAVIDRLGLLHLAERPAANIVRTRQADAHRAIVVDSIIVHLTRAHMLNLQVEKLSRCKRPRDTDQCVRSAFAIIAAPGFAW